MKNPILSLLAALSLACLLHAPSAAAQAESPPQLSLEIRCTENLLKVGDQVPIEFTIKNNGTQDYTYRDQRYERPGLIADEYKLTARTASAQMFPTRLRTSRWLAAAPPSLVFCTRARLSSPKIVPLNIWALIKEPGRDQVTGSYFLEGYGNPAFAPATSAPISLTILPRTQEEMRDYIQGLSRQIDS